MKKIKISLLILVSLLTPAFIVNAENLIPDTNPPVISIIGNANVRITQDDSYTDAGATAQDDTDGDITSNIIVINSVDTTKIGTYMVSYNVTDQAGNKATEIMRTVEVIAPVFKENILIRNGDNVVWQGDFDLPAASTIDVLDKSGSTHKVNANSVLGVLYSLDQVNDSFEISDLEYYPSFNAFYLKCITPKDKPEVCDNWQYVVGGVTPFTGMDTTILSGGESIGLYFGNPHQVVLDKTSMSTGESFTATAEKYNYIDNTWSPLTSVTIGVTLPDPNDSWNPILVKEQAVDVDGKASILLNDVNTYTVGIKEDYYFPSYTLNVISNQNGGGGGTTQKTLDIAKAASFLMSNKSPDGSFGSSLYTDWVAIAAAAAQNSSLKNSLNSYLSNNPLNSSLLTDNERRAMALMTLGINPYSGTNVNYITKIISAFDGVQFGDSSLTNDDIFALIVLKNVGYTSNDDVIKKSASYIVAHQGGDGSWGSVDMTAAGIQALRNFVDLPDVSSSISKAENYLKNSQSNDGGFGNSSSTSWALQVLSQNNQITNADAYIASLQQTDGGVELSTSTLENRIWATAYAIVGALHMPWNSVMQSFSKQVTQQEAGNNTEQTKPKIEEVKTIDKKIEEIKIPIKEQLPILKVKKSKAKIKINKSQNKEILPITPINEGTSSLSASAGNSQLSHSLPYRVIHGIRDAILTPFVWLFLKLGF